MNDPQWNALSGAQINRANQRHRDAQDRRDLIAYLGIEPEDPASRYAASTSELLVWAREKAGTNWRSVPLLMP